MKILLVEDQSSYANTLGDILEGKGHEVTRAVDPSRANGILSENEFGLIVVDLNMRTIGLTKEEISEYAWMGRDVVSVIKEVDATLKEKNT